MVGGEHPGLTLDYYVDLIRSLHEALPDVHLKCFTASEIHHITTLSGLTHEQVLRELRAVGLGSLPGGGAEVFSHRVRQIVAPGKESPEQWLEVHRLAHGMGMPTHCTMLYNHVENYEERIDHLLRLRELQDETGGFLAFIPLPFHPENTVFERRGWAHTTGHDDLKMQAVSRLMLDNIPNIKAYWIMISTPLAQVALHFGANDIQGTVVEETIAHAGGATTPTEEKIADLVRVISEAGRIPVQRDTHYNVAAPVRRADRALLSTPIRLGRVAFINTYPVEWALARHLPEGEAVEVTGVPTALNRMLRAGEIDVANCSSIEYAHGARAVRAAALDVRRLGRRRRLGAARDRPARSSACARSPRRRSRRPRRRSRACCCRTPSCCTRTPRPTRAC